MSVVCKQCGHDNESDDVFCGSCGAFLEWMGERTPEAVPATPVAEPGADAAAARQAEAEAASAEARRQEELARVRQEAEQQAAEARRAAEEADARLAEEARARADAEAAAARAQEVAEQAASRAAAEMTAKEEVAAAARADQEAQPAAAPAEGGAAPTATDQAEAEAGRAKAAAEQAARDADAARQRAEAEATARAAAQAAADQAARDAEAARERAEAESKARAEAEAAAAAAREEEERRAEAARRAAAMVAQPRATEPDARGATSTPAAATTALPGEGTGPAEPIAAQLPAEEQRRTPPRRPAAAEREIKPGDLICGECGAGNDPTRKFCRRCGHSLVEAAVATVKIPWWRRLFGGRKPKSVPAGTRPGRPAGTTTARSGTSANPTALARKGRGFLGRFRVVFMVLAVLGIAIVVAGPLRGRAGDAASSVRRTIKPEYDPVHPVSAAATSSARGHDPGLAIDGIRNTFWAEGAPGSGAGQTITVRFSQPTDIDKIGVTPGASTQPQQFVAEPRPRVLHVVLNGSTVGAKDITLKDEPKFHSFDIKGRAVTSVVISIVSVYEGTTGSDCAIAELEFFQKR